MKRVRRRGRNKGNEKKTYRGKREGMKERRRDEIR